MYAIALIRELIKKNCLSFQVFIGEMLSARVSHLHLRLDKSDVVTKTKSSGLCVSTGTGSTSWLTSMNRLSTNNVKDLIDILKRQTQSSALDGIDPAAVSEEYNQNLVYAPDDPRLCYSIREQICVGVWPNPKGLESRGFAKQITVKSRCIDASELGKTVGAGVSTTINGVPFLPPRQA